MRAKYVPRKDAAKVAVSFYRWNNPIGLTNPQLLTQYVRSWDKAPTIYIFSFVSGAYSEDVLEALVNYFN
jgi:hypothetical protein